MLSAFSCPWMLLVAPVRYDTSVAVAALTVNFPDPSVIIARFAVALFVKKVVRAPVTVACFESIWVWIVDVAPFKYPNSVDVMLLEVMFPLSSVITTELTGSVAVVIVDAAPVIAGCVASNCC